MLWATISMSTSARCRIKSNNQPVTHSSTNIKFLTQVTRSIITMKSTFFITALMSSVAIAHKFDHFVNAVSINFTVDNDWEYVNPVQAATTTTTTRRFRPALSTSSTYSCTTTPAIPAVVTLVSSTYEEWNHVKYG